MNRYLRRALIGAIAGLLASMVLATTGALKYPLLALVLGTVLGAATSLLFARLRGGYMEGLMTGGSFGVPLWALFNLVLFPTFLGKSPQWDAEGMRAEFPGLVGWVCYGVLLGLFLRAADDLAARLLGPEPEPAPDPEP